MPRYHIPKKIQPFIFAVFTWWFVGSAIAYLTMIIDSYVPALIGIIIDITGIIIAIIITYKAYKWYKRKFVTPTPPGNARRQYAFPNKPN